MSDRLASGVIVSGLLRMTEREGGFGAVIARGDDSAGAIVIVLAERGQRVKVLERVMKANGAYAWGEAIGGGRNDEELDKFLEKRRRFDPDSWILELDTASAERLAAEIAAID